MQSNWSEESTYATRLLNGRQLLRQLLVFERALKFVLWSCCFHRQAHKHSTETLQTALSRLYIQCYNYTTQHGQHPKNTINRAALYRTRNICRWAPLKCKPATRQSRIESLATTVLRSERPNVFITTSYASSMLSMLQQQQPQSGWTWNHSDFFFLVFVSCFITISCAHVTRYL